MYVILIKAIESNTGNPFYWLVRLKQIFQNANQCHLIPVELSVKTAVKQ